MSINFHRQTLEVYLDQLSRREPVPGGGSAAALTAALGAGLISMVANYSIGRKSNTKAVEQRLIKILRTSETIRKRLLELTSLDSQAYLKTVEARKSGDAKAQQHANRQAAAVGREVCLLCYKTIDLIPFLIVKGNPYLVSDLEVAAELLQAGFNSSMVMVRINQ
jgi:methenyltetrahydrofolate cyclohydrolase